MMNCAVGMNNKNALKVADRVDAPAWQLSAFGLVLSLIDVIFNQRWLLSLLLARFATAKTVRGALEGSVYVHADRVDRALVDDYLSLASDRDAAVEVLRQIYTNDGGPTPFEAAAALPADFDVLCVWGDRDNLAPATGPVGTYFRQRADELAGTTFFEISAGHVPQDDNPEATNGILREWLAGLPRAGSRAPRATA
jgi:pimeloyl-ACP methyl ester carboxylesterase